jgi:hypothetical protein
LSHKREKREKALHGPSQTNRVGRTLSLSLDKNEGISFTNKLMKINEQLGHNIIF